MENLKNFMVVLGLNTTMKSFKFFTAVLIAATLTQLSPLPIPILLLALEPPQPAGHRFYATVCNSHKAHLPHVPSGMEGCWGCYG